MQTPAPFEYERATSVEGAIASLAEHRSRGTADRRRAQPAADDEAAAREPRVPDRHQRPRRALLHRRADHRDPDRGADAARRTARLRAARAPYAGVPRRRGGDRRPGRPQPRHDRRIAVPGRRRRGPVRGVRGAEGQRRDPGPGRRARHRHGRVLHRAVHDGGRRRARCSPRSGSRSVAEPAARTRRSSGAPATSRSRRCRPRCGSRAARSPTPGIALGALGPTTIIATRAEEAAEGQAALGGAVRAGGRDRQGGLLAGRPTDADRSTTSATSRACSPSARCAAPPPAPCSRRQMSAVPEVMTWK